MIVILGPTKQAADNSPIFVAILVAIIAAVAAIGGAIISARTQKKVNTFQGDLATQQGEHEQRLQVIAQGFTLRQGEIQHRLSQLNELYGPLVVLRAQSSELRRS